MKRRRYYSNCAKDHFYNVMSALLPKRISCTSINSETLSTIFIVRVWVLLSCATLETWLGGPSRWHVYLYLSLFQVFQKSFFFCTQVYLKVRIEFWKVCSSVKNGIYIKNWTIGASRKWSSFSLKLNAEDCLHSEQYIMRDMLSKFFWTEFIL